MTNHRWPLLAALGGTLLTVGGYLGYRHLSRKERLISDRRYIACIGDSITFGAGVVRQRKKKAWPYLLGQSLGNSYQVLNYGISGATAQDSGDFPYHKNGFLEDALRAKAEAYFLMLGTNDSKPYNWNSDGYEAAMRTLVSEIRERCPDARIVLMLPPKAFPSEKGVIEYDISDAVIRDEIIPILHKIADEQELETIDLYEITETHPEYFDDGVHPNELGNRRIAEHIRQYL